MTKKFVKKFKHKNIRTRTSCFLFIIAILKLAGKIKEVYCVISIFWRIICSYVSWVNIKNSRMRVQDVLFRRRLKHILFVTPGQTSWVHRQDIQFFFKKSRRHVDVYWVLSLKKQEYSYTKHKRNLKEKHNKK